jgi:prolyl 4-hydroxylase
MAPKPQKKDEKKSAKKDMSTVPPRQDLAIPWGGIAVAILSLALGILTPRYLKRVEVISDPLQRRILEDDAPAGASHAFQDPCGERRLRDFWHDSAVTGFHIICLRAPDLDATQEEKPRLELVFYKNGLRNRESKTFLPVLTDWTELKGAFVEHLGLQPAEGEWQPWAIFSPDGRRLVSENSKETVKGMYPVSLTEEHGMVLLFEGGQFIWPGVRIGFERKVDLFSVMQGTSPHLGNDSQRTVTLETLAINPLVFSVSGFLTESECSHIQEIATPSLEYSGVQLMDQDVGRPASDFRTSQTTFVDAAGDDVLIDIDYRTASLVRVPRNHQEHTQVLRYGVTEHYVSHHDFFDPTYYQNDPDTLRLTKHGARNRLATVFWYLTTVEAGGETVFPRAYGGQERSFSDCETGLLVKPVVGKVIIFYSLKADGRTDEKSLHGACPVKEGIKWAANKWVWNEPMMYTPN